MEGLGRWCSKARPHENVCTDSCCYTKPKQYSQPLRCIVIWLDALVTQSEGEAKEEMDCSLNDAQRCLWKDQADESTNRTTPEDKEWEGWTCLQRDKGEYGKEQAHNETDQEAECCRTDAYREAWRETIAHCMRLGRPNV